MTNCSSRPFNRLRAPIFAAVTTCFCVGAACAEDEPAQPAVLPPAAVLEAEPSGSAGGAVVTLPNPTPISATGFTSPTSAAPSMTEQPIREAKAKQASFYGLTDSQIEKRFGKPDDRVTKSTGSEEWRYGKSVFFFSGGKVNAWSDGGELTEHEQQTSLKKAPLDHDDSLSGEWPNPWTPGKREGKDEIDILGE